MSELWNEFTSVFTDLWDYAKEDWRTFVAEAFTLLVGLMAMYLWLLLGSMNNG